MLSFSQIQNDVWDHLKEVAGTDEFWSETEVKRALNDVYYDIAYRLRCFRTQFIIEVKANERKYKLPSNYVIGSLTIVEYDGKKIWPITYEEISLYNRSWRSTPGTPTHYIVGMDADDEIDLYPKPVTDGPAYNTISDSAGDYGLIVAVSDDTYEQFAREEITIIDISTGDVEINGERRVVQRVLDPIDNLLLHYAKFPKRLYGDNEVFLQPISNNPGRILTKGALAILFEKDGRGKDIAKSSYYNKRFDEAVIRLDRPRLNRTHRMRSISEGGYGMGLNLGEHYPTYRMR